MAKRNEVYFVEGDSKRNKMRATLLITRIQSFISILQALNKIDRFNSAMDQSGLQRRGFSKSSTHKNLAGQVKFLAKIQ